MLSQENGFHECMKLIIRSGADVNFRENNRCRTALMEAAYSRDHKSVHILIDSGADVNCTTDTGLTPLMFAADYNEWVPGNFCIKHLLNAGAHVNKINKFGQNALQISVASNTTFCYRQEDYGNHRGKDIIMLLLAAGESIEGNTVQRINLYGHCDRTIDIPTYLFEFRQVKTILEMGM